MLHVQDIHTCVVFGSPPGLAPLTDFVKLDVSDEQSHKKKFGVSVEFNLGNTQASWCKDCSIPQICYVNI